MERWDTNQITMLGIKLWYARYVSTTVIGPFPFDQLGFMSHGSKQMQTTT